MSEQAPVFAGLGGFWLWMGLVVWFSWGIPAATAVGGTVEVTHFLLCALVYPLGVLVVFLLHRAGSAPKSPMVARLVRVHMAFAVLLSSIGVAASVTMVGLAWLVHINFGASMFLFR